jgi:hypothetical protein
MDAQASSCAPVKFMSTLIALRSRQRPFLRIGKLTARKILEFPNALVPGSGRDNRGRVTQEQYRFPTRSTFGNSFIKFSEALFKRHRRSRLCDSAFSGKTTYYVDDALYRITVVGIRLHAGRDARATVGR